MTHTVNFTYTCTLYTLIRNLRTLVQYQPGGLPYFPRDPSRQQDYPAAYQPFFGHGYQAQPPPAQQVGQASSSYLYGLLATPTVEASSSHQNTGELST